MRRIEVADQNVGFVRGLDRRQKSDDPRKRWGCACQNYGFKVRSFNGGTMRVRSMPSFEEEQTSISRVARVRATPVCSERSKAIPVKLPNVDSERS